VTYCGTPTELADAAIHRDGAPSLASVLLRSLLPTAADVGRVCSKAARPSPHRGDVLSTQRTTGREALVPGGRLGQGPQRERATLLLYGVGRELSSTPETTLPAGDDGENERKRS
jgi:hypothetical protein